MFKEIFCYEEMFITLGYITTSTKFTPLHYPSLCHVCSCNLCFQLSKYISTLQTKNLKSGKVQKSPFSPFSLQDLSFWKKV